MAQEKDLLLNADTNRIRHLKVSAIISSFNRYQSLMRAIESVKNQTHPNIEIVVVNDKSTQREYYDMQRPSGVIWIDLEKSSRERFGFPAPGYSKNVAIAHATGDYYAILDDDDAWMPEKTACQLNVMVSGGWDISCTEAYIGDGFFNPATHYPLYHADYYEKFCKKFFIDNFGAWDGKLPGIFDLSLIRKHNFIIHSSVIFNKQLLKKAGMYKEDIRIHNKAGVPVDWDLWIRILEYTNILHIDAPLIYYDGRLQENLLYKKIGKKLKRLFS